MEGVFMTTKGNIFTKAGRIFVVAAALTLFAGTVTGCGKKTEKEEAESRTRPMKLLVRLINC
jgi:hypothetical protein